MPTCLGGPPLSILHTFYRQRMLVTLFFIWRAFCDMREFRNLMFPLRFVVRPLRWFFCLLGQGPSILFLVFTLFQVFWFIYDWQNFMLYKQNATNSLSWKDLQQNCFGNEGLMRLQYCPRPSFWPVMEPAFLEWNPLRSLGTFCTYKLWGKLHSFPKASIRTRHHKYVGPTNR